MRKIHKVKYLLETCRASPTQFEGVTDEGESVYIRYRFGTLRFGVGKSISNAMDKGNYHMAWCGGDEYDGYMDRADLKKYLAKFLDLSNTHWNMNQNFSKRERNDRRNGCIWYEMFGEKIKRVTKSPFKKGRKPRIKFVNNPKYTEMLHLIQKGESLE